MKKMLLIFSVCALILAGCEKDSYKPGQGVDPDPSYEPIPRVDGRVAIAYVTYYGTSIPDASVLTNICYSFAELYVKDGKYQGFKLQGDESRFKNVISIKKQHPEVKISLSFTHTIANSDNAQGGGFSLMASTDEGRKAFAEDCRAFLINWGLDGIDIDWELPGISWSGHACNPLIDTDNFTLLMKQLRETLGSKYLLSFAGYVMDKKPTDDGTGWKFIDLKAVEPYVDFMNIMTYDLSSAPQHHSALRDSKAYWDCERSVNAYLAAGVAPEKMVLGIPFYGRHSFDVSPTAIDYKKILLMDSKIYKIDNWDESASVPYVSVRSSNAFYCGYDNPKSIAIKAEWAHRLGLKGLMYWDYDADDSRGTLRNAVWDNVMKQ